MILNKYVEIKISKKNIEHFKLYYKDIKLKDIIKVDPKNLQNNSNFFIDVSCDICNIERKIKYQAYYKNINSCEKYPIYTCDKCSHVKIKAYNNNKWGVDYYCQTEEYTNRFKKTMKERWGVEYALQSEELKEKVKKTNLKKFGYENPFMDNERIRKKFAEKWGVDHPIKVPEIYTKMQNSNLKSTGYKSAFSSPKIREKIKKIFLEKYGSIYPSQSNICRSDFVISKDPQYLKYISDQVSMFECKDGHIFYMDSVSYHNRKRSNLPLCTVCYPISNSRSIKESELFNFINSIYNKEIVQNYRDGLEIDIYLPDLKLGFEFNGLYWHSDEWKDKNYHKNKINYFKEKGIKIIHIWEDDWDYKNDIIKSQIRNNIGLTIEKIWARKCQVKEINDISTIKDFLNNNHIQGWVTSVVKIGLYYEDKLVAIMLFDHNEGRKKMNYSEWNLSRFCNKINTSVVGGASKLLTYFIKNYKSTRIISYSDNDWSNGNLYYKLGFEFINEGSPDYKYILGDKRVHKSRFRKSKIKAESISESAFMKNIGILKIWDCGKTKFSLAFNK